MERELAEKFATDEKFMDFCKVIDCLKEQGGKIKIPYETALMLCNAGVDFIKGAVVLDTVHKAVVDYLGHMPEAISFYDYFVLEVIGRCNEWQMIIWP